MMMMMMVEVRGHVDAGSDGKMQVELAIGDDSSTTDIHKMCTTDSLSCRHPRDACTDVFLLEHGYYDDEPASKLLLVPHTGTFSTILLTPLREVIFSLLLVFVCLSVSLSVCLFVSLFVCLFDIIK